MIRLALLATAALALAGCGTTSSSPPVIRTVTVTVPTPVSCVPANTPPRPTFRDDAESLKRADGPGRYRLLAGEWRLKQNRLELLESIVDACRKAAPPPAK